MIATTITKEARNIANCNRDLGKKIKHKTFCAIISLFLLNKRSLYQGVREMSFAPSVSTLSREIRKINPHEMLKKMQRYVLKKMKKSNPKDWFFAIDDTSNPKYSKGLYRSDYWGSSSGVYMGQKIMVLVIVNLKTKKCYPVSYAIIPKRVSKRSPKMHRHALRIIRDALIAGFPPLTLVADSWFDSVYMMKKVQAMGMEMVVQIKNNRNVKDNPNPYVKWLKLPDFFNKEKRIRSKGEWDARKVKEGKKPGKCLAEKVLQIKGRKSPVKIVAAFLDKRSNKVYGYFCSTDRNMPRARVWALSRARWSIECLFRTCKQNLSFGKLSLRGKQAAHLAVVFPLYLYAKLSDQRPKTLTLDQYLAQIRNESSRKAIFNLTSQIDKRAAEVLRNRLATERTHRKPVDSGAGRFKMVS